MLYAIVIYLLILYVFKDYINSKLRVFLVLLPFLTIIWTRYGLGADYFSYEDIYNSLDFNYVKNLYTTYTNIDFGYKLLVMPFRLLDIPFHIFVATLNTATLLILAKWVYDNSDDFEMSMLLFYSMFFLVWILSATRQSIVLVVGLYYLFNRRKNLGIVKSLIVILILSRFHTSAYLLIIFVILNRVKWTKTLQIYFMVGGIVTTLLPLKEILTFLDFIPGVNRVIVNYLSDSYVFYDFPGLVRLFVFISLIFFYDKLKSKKMLTDATLYGLSLYFYLKFSEITAARSTIFTFVIVVILIPDILKGFKYEMVLVPILLMAGSFVYLNKEVKSMFYQTEYMGDVSIMTYPNIFNQDKYVFGSRSYYQSSLKHKIIGYGKEYSKKESKPSIVSYDPNKHYYTIKYIDTYAIIDSDGNYLNREEYKYSVEVIEGILISYGSKQDDFFSYPILTDLSGLNRTESEMREAIMVSKDTTSFEKQKEETIDSDVSMIPSEFDKFYPNKDNIEKTILKKISDPFEYYIMKIEYLDRTSYIYLNTDFKPLVEFPVPNLKAYNSSGFLILNPYGHQIIVNELGTILLWE